MAETNPDPGFIDDDEIDIDRYFDEIDDDYDHEFTCDCGEFAIDECTICGWPMCGACFEMNGGVCDHHS
jgi:hypothetical protein